jgi:hypothetical protein
MWNLILLVACLILSGAAPAQESGVVIASDYNSAATVAAEV